MFNKKMLTDLDVKGKKVLVRVDFNVPLKDGKITDDTRIQAALPTIQYLLEHGAGVILMSHLGRPKGKVNLEFTLKPVADYLATLISAPVKFASDCRGELAKKAAAELKMGEVLVLENTRFYAEEELNDAGMSKDLASLGDLFVNDAFGTAHRAHASTAGIADYLPAAAGFLMEKEIQYLGNAIDNPVRPFVTILGGAKISDKIGVIENLLKKADKILIGGGMANTFLAAKGYAMADSLVEADSVEKARELLSQSEGKIVLPLDLVIANAFDADAQLQTIPLGDVPAGWRVLDIGCATVKAFGAEIQAAGTIVWNGPMGVFEFPRFAEGTFAVARAVADSHAVSVIGGGDSVAAINQSGLSDRITHISTGGGASLEMLEGLVLPGLAVLADR